MFNIGAGELILIAVAALLVLGPQRLPEFARVVGKYLREFHRQADEVRSVVQREMYTMDQDLDREKASSPPAQPLLTPPGKGEGHLLHYKDVPVEPVPVSGTAQGLAPPSVTDVLPGVEPLPGAVSPSGAAPG
ncbi:MAG TPA: twin-arginine translocase TatA/TatE family subunit [Archangium sp.]|uniref:Sec-independent protein translocase subunit TatA/TatB n=1 Tax=Archangium sp. TaxID=1872627 RepID=UPI002E367609|nr:twin-arginine translocase TatA/TatE family subunit [Archangium sp.]HEX5751362.1 twin-arginine translocase TatA/TatE family subunit [Archangium sp.]